MCEVTVTMIHSNKKAPPTRRAAEARTVRAQTAAHFISSASSASSTGSASPSPPPQTYVTPPSLTREELDEAQTNRPKKGLTVTKKKEAKQRLFVPCVSTVKPALEGLPLLKKVETVGKWVRDCLKESGNIKTSVKEALTMVPEMYLALILEAMEERKTDQSAVHKGEAELEREKEEIGKMIEERTGEMTVKFEELRIEAKEQQTRLMEKIEERNRKMEELMGSLQESMASAAPRPTYAEVATNRPPVRGPERTALHSIVVASEDVVDTSEDVLDNFRKAVNAKDGGVNIEKVRKVKDQKIVVGCRTKADIEKVQERLGKAKGLRFEDLKNKDPMVILRGVLIVNSDEDILTALRNQNGPVFEDLKSDEDRVSLKYKRKTRNPHTQHVVLTVSPTIWGRLTERGFAHIDVQRVRVEDQSPLVQCSLCLGYGHSRRFCTEKAEKCCHCGGPHMRSQCADWKAGTSPRCTNCADAKLEALTHNAFSEECPVRRRWEDVARATVAYC